MMPKNDSPISEWARWYVQDLGMAVVYMSPGTKSPTYDGWNKPGGYPLQHTGAKMDTAVLMHSIIEGSGKSLLFSVVMGLLYGQYSATVGQTQLEGNFNAWQSGKLWAVFEEVVSRDQRYNQVGKIKQLITGQTVRIESKFVNGWEEASHMNAVSGRLPKLRGRRG